MTSVARWAPVIAMLAAGLTGCSHHHSHAGSPPRVADSLTGLGATSESWISAHGGLNVGGFSKVMAQPVVYSFTESFSLRSQAAAEALVHQQLPSDAKVVHTASGGGACEQVFYNSNLMAKQAPGLGFELSVYLYSPTRYYSPQRVSRAIVSDLGVSTDRPC